jgi:hypothetical protein
MTNKTAPQIDETTGVRADAAIVPPANIPDFTDAPALPIVYRSTLERYAGCCVAARAVELRRVIDNSRPADIGSEVHEAFSLTTQEYVTGGIECGPSDLADLFRGRLLQSRPDIQPEVLDAAYHTAWPWATFLAGTPREGGGIHPASIERFDGGEGDRSGQLAVDLPDEGVTLSAELDFLYRGRSPEVLHEVDWKSGWKGFSTATIFNSFQFQMHAWLVFANYPEASQLEVSVWRTREGSPSKPVVFDRDDLKKIDYRIHSALNRWRASQGLEPEQCELVPGRETCPLCPATTLCPVGPPDSVAADPAGYVVAYFALKTHLDLMHDELAAYAKENGDVRACGLAFGFDKPPAKRTAALYFEGGSDAADNDA